MGRIAKLSRGSALWCAVFLLPALAHAATPSTGQQARQARPVLALRQVLRTPADANNPQARAQALKLRVADLTLPSNLRDALALVEWRDLDPSDPAIAAVDLQARTAIANKLGADLVSALHNPNPDIQLAAIHMIAQMGSSVRGPKPGQSFASTLAPELQALMLQPGNPQVRATAAESLGKAYPRQDAAVATAALGKLLHSDDVIVRLGAAQGLVGLSNAELQRIKVPLPNYQNATEETQAQMLQSIGTIGAAVVAVASTGLTDPNMDVRYRCLSAIYDAVDTVYQESSVPPTGGTGATSFLPFTRVMDDKAPLLANVLTNGRPDMRTLVAKTLVDLAIIRRNLLFGSPRRPVTPPAPRRGPGVNPLGPRAALDLSFPAHDDAAVTMASAQGPPLPQPRAVESTSPGQLSAMFRKLFPAMEAALRDPDFHVRLQSVEALEMLGNDASSFAPALAQTMCDPNLFVRWAAARTVGELGPVTNVQTNAANVNGLLALLDNQGGDVDVRLAAATALERWGPDAIQASVANDAAARVVPVLARAMIVQKPDPEVEVGIIQALQAIHPTAPEGIQAVVQALSNPDSRVRVAAANALAIIGSNTPNVINALTRSLSDTDEEVRQSASSAILDITQRAKT